MRFVIMGLVINIVSSMYGMHKYHKYDVMPYEKPKVKSYEKFPCKEVFDIPYPKKKVRFAKQTSFSSQQKMLKSSSFIPNQPPNIISPEWLIICGVVIYALHTVINCNVPAYPPYSYFD